jgi:Protein of unknown function (DUF1501)
MNTSQVSETMPGPTSRAEFSRSCHAFTRRAFLSDLGMGFTGLALGALLHDDRVARASDTGGSVPDGMPHFTPKAKSVIWFFLNGGVSHLDTFDPKPELNKYGGKTIQDTPFRGAQDPKKLANARVVVVSNDSGTQRNTLFPPQVGFTKHGQSGIEISDWLPHIGGCVDDIALIRSLYTTDNNHGAQTEFHSGRHMLDGEFPNLGAWVHYGLGSLNDNLPQYVSMGIREYWNKSDGHYLGPSHDAVPLRIDPASPLDYGRPELEVRDAEQRIGFDLVSRLNRLRAVEYPNDPALLARIQSYELAFRMQKSLPEALDFRNEPMETKRLYGLDDPATEACGMQLLAARRLVERGVRFVQIQDGAGGAGVWDAHSGLRANHRENCHRIDKPVAGLLCDLKRRGMLNETIVVFGTEFGRTPGSQLSDGRDHHIYGFSAWMAGGGLKAGVVHGATDEIGFHAEENRHYVTDIHATILRLLGLDSRKLEIPGRKRLDIDHGKPIHEIIA